MSAAPSLDEVFDLARRLPRTERGRLIARLAEDLAGDEKLEPARATSFDLPVISGGTWSDDIPMSRKELYDDDERG